MPESSSIVSMPSLNSALLITLKIAKNSEHSEIVKSSSRKVQFSIHHMQFNNSSALSFSLFLFICC